LQLLFAQVGIAAAGVVAAYNNNRKLGSQEGMKRSTLIISDDAHFNEWVGCIVTMRWPKMCLESARLANAPMYLDRAELDRYNLIVIRTGFQSFSEIQTCIFLMRILALESRPEVVLICDSAHDLEKAKTTKLGQAYCVLTSNATPGVFQAIFDDITEKTRETGPSSKDGAPDIPGYDIQYPLAATYSTTVYRAYSKNLNRDVALKVCNSQPFNYGNYHQLTLRQEYDILRKLGGEYIAHAYEYGEVDNMAFIALEFFPNGCLSQYIRKNGRNVSRVDYLLKVAKALRQIHDAGFLHLDLKPNNVLIREDGSPVLIDFGISKRILLARHQDRQVFSLGSPYFMSPEQARGERLDVRSDIYSFGALWFRIFTGKVPFGGRTFEELRLARDNKAPSMGEVLRHYQPIVDNTLTADRDARYASAEELIENIEYHTSSATGVYRCLDMQEIERQASLASA
jgi:hypothetical protein